MNRRFTECLKKSVALYAMWLCGQPLLGFAANPNTLPSYHIEMVIFERTSAAYSPPEYWPENAVLTYPPNYRVILSPEQNVTLTANETSPNLEVTADTNNPQALAAISKRILLERPKSSYLLINEARSINRKSSMRVLFHKAWQQTLTRTDESPSLIINGGDTFNSRTELGGSIRFSVNKFIHVDTQLWLARFTPNVGQELNWPIPPIAPTATSIQSAASTSLKHQETTINLEKNTDDFDLNTKPLSARFHYSNPTSTAYESDTHNTYSGTMGLQNNLRPPLFAGEPQATFSHITREVTTLVQSRRMRSQELHYIDHPRLGILVKAIPITETETETETETQGR